MSILYSTPYICRWITLVHGFHTGSGHFGNVLNILHVAANVLPLIILTFLTVNFVTAIRKRDRVRRNMRHNQAPQDNSIVVILIAILITFLICQLSVAIGLTGFLLVDYGFIIWFPAYRFFEIAYIFIPVNSAANGFVYFFCNKQFRVL